jgi:hypothetical protein
LTLYFSAKIIENCDRLSKLDRTDYLLDFELTARFCVLDGGLHRASGSDKAVPLLSDVGMN